MSGEKEIDQIEAIAIGIETLGFDIGSGFERRAKAGLVEQSLKLCGWQIVSAPEMLELVKDMKTWPDSIRREHGIDRIKREQTR